MSEYLSTNPNDFTPEKSEYLSTDPDAFKPVPPKKEQGFVSGMVDAAVGGVKSTVRNIGAFGNAITGDYKSVEEKSVDAQDAEAKSPEAKKAFLADVQSRKAANPDQDAWGAIKDVGSAALDNKEGVAQFVVEQAPNSAVSLGGAWAGAKTGAAIGSKINPVYGTAVGGALGFLGGMFMGNWALEGGGEAISKAEGGLTKDEADEAVAGTARKAGVITAVDAATFKLGGVAAKAINNPAIRAGARAEAKSLADAGVDITNIAAINAALANPVIRKAAEEAGELAAKQASSIGRKAASAGIQVAGETFGEGAGEYIGELAKDGEADAYDAVLESLAGLTMSVPEAAYNINEARGNNLDAKGIQGSGPFEPTDQPVTPTTPVVEPTVEAGFTPEEVAAFKAEQAANQATMQRDLGIQRGMAEVNAGNDILPVEDEQVIAPAQSYAQQQEDAANQFLENQQPESYLQWAQSVDLGDLILSAPNNVAKEALTVSEILSGPYDVAVKEQAAARLWNITQSARIQTPDTLPEDAGILTKLAAIGTQTGAVPLNKWGFHQQPVVADVADVAIDPSAESAQLDAVVDTGAMVDAPESAVTEQPESIEPAVNAGIQSVTPEFESEQTASAIDATNFNLPAGYAVTPVRGDYGFNGSLAIQHNGKKVGFIDAWLDHQTGEVRINKVELDAEHQGKRIAKLAYIGLNNALSSTGQGVLGSDTRSMTQSALNMWKSLVRDGIARERVDGRIGYEFIPSQQTTPATPLPESGANQPVTQDAPASQPVESAEQQSPQEPEEYAAARSFISGIDGGGVVLDARKVNQIARNLGLEVSMSARPEDTIQRVRDAISRFDSQKSGEPVAPQPEQVVTQEGEAQSPQGTPEPVVSIFDQIFPTEALAKLAIKARNLKDVAVRQFNGGFRIGAATGNTRRENAKESTDLITRIIAYGGIRSGSLARDTVRETNANKMRPGLFSKNGHNLDRLIELARLESDFGISDTDALQKAVDLAVNSKEPTKSFAGQEAEAEALIKKRADDAFAKQSELEAELKKADEEVARLEQEAKQEVVDLAKGHIVELDDVPFDVPGNSTYEAIYGDEDAQEQGSLETEEVGTQGQDGEVKPGATAASQEVGQSGTPSPEVDTEDQGSEEGIETDPADDAATPLSNATAPEHVVGGVDDRELGEIIDAFNEAQTSMVSDDERITHVFDPPNRNEIIRLENKTRIYHKDHGWMTVSEAKDRIAEWKENASNQGENASKNGNSDRIILSLFDLTGSWSQPWEDAGYQVYRFDIQADPDLGDVNKFDTEFFNDNFGAFDGQDIYAVLAACPCTDFANSGAKHFGAKDKDGRTIASVKLVHQTLSVIEFFKPAVWAIENPVGRIGRLGGLPPWRLSFNPNHLGDPYTKKTLLWGRFNADLPIAPVDPVEGSKMHRLYGGKSLATKNARSQTPEGFSYGFFMANNAIDNPVMAIANKYDRLDREVIKQAVDAGITEAQISDAVDDFYYMDMDDDAANKAIADLVDAQSNTDEEAPALELTGETPEELKANDDARIEREKQLAADAKKAEAAEREAAIEKERQSRADIAADEFSLDPTESSQDVQKKADKAKADDQFAGQGGLFGGEQAQPVEKHEPATLTIDDIPAGFMINFKVSLPVINTVTNAYEAGEAGAEDALNETRSDIKKMKDLIGCLQG